jgi:hypothetical protein
MPYHIERSGSQYAVVDENGKTVGTHPTKGKAAAQVRALYANVPDATKEDVIRYGRRRNGIGDSHSGMNAGGAVGSVGGDGMGISAADQIKELASVIKQLVEEIPGGTPQEQTVEETGGYDGCGCETCKAMNVDCPDCPACSPKNVEDGKDAEFEAAKPDPVDAYDNSIGKEDCCPDGVEKQAPCWEGYVQRGMKPGDGGKMVPNCVPAGKADDLFEDDDTVVYESDSVSKADGYSPPAGARAAARKAIKFKEDGKANGAGTAVGWTRAGQLARGESLSLSTVKRMYSYFSRHEVDKKGKDWANQSNPSNGYIMWLAWGGDAGFSWARSIVERESKKAVWSGSAFSLRKQ